jgi:hypothetical protein
MATKKTKVEAKASKKKELTAEEKKARREAMKERLKNRPEGQRPNSKQIDVITTEAGGKVINYAMPVRKLGSLITSVAYDAEGNVVSTSVVLVPGVSPKSKKGHGTLVPKVPGMGKAGKAAVEADDTEEDED